MLSGYRQWARLQIHRTGPRVLVNSIPKAGTHLLTAELAKFPELMNSRTHLATADFVKGGREARPSHLRPADLDLKAVRRKIAAVRPGQFFTSHMAYTEAFSDLLAENDIRVVNLIRDPRDIMVSNFHYLKGLRRHRIHRFSVGLGGDRALYDAILRGRSSSPRILPYANILGEYVGWTKDPRVLTVRFEELVGVRGGGSDEEKGRALARIRHHAGLARCETNIADVVRETTSVTFRKGTIGSWRQELPPEILDQFLEFCGDHLHDLGYIRSVEQFSVESL